MAINHESKRRAMNAVNNPQSASIARAITQMVHKVGLAPIAMGAAVYYAKIREADREMKMQQPSASSRPVHYSQVKRDRTGREI